MNQPIDYVLDPNVRLVSCHCQAGFICPNTGQAVDSKNRCRILVRKRPRYTWPARAFIAGLVITGLTCIAVSLGYLLA